MKDLPRSIHWVTTSLSFFPTLSSPFLEKLPKTSFLSSFLSNQTIQISLIHQIDIICYFKSILHFISFYYTNLLRKTRIKNGTRKISHVLFSYPFWCWRKSCSKSVHVRTILLEKKERGKKGEKDRRYIDGGETRSAVIETKVVGPVSRRGRGYYVTFRTIHERSVSGILLLGRGGQAYGYIRIRWRMVTAPLLAV